MESHSIYTEIQDNCSTVTIKAEGNGQQKLSGTVRFPLSFCGFDGHFPVMPVLPAIVQLGVVRAVCEKAMAIKLVPLSIEKTKFKGMVGPEDEIAVTILLNEENQHYVANFTISGKNGTRIASGVIKYVTCK